MTTIEHDPIYLAKVLAKGYAEQVSQRIGTSSAAPWVLVEKLATKRYPLHSSMLSSGKVPEPADRLRWVRASFGDIRVVSRDASGTKFAVCFPEKATYILECLMADKSFQVKSEALKLGYYFHLEAKGKWTVAYKATTAAGVDILSGTCTHEHLDVCVHKAIDEVVSGVHFEPETRRDDRKFFPEGLGHSLMGFPYKPFMTACMLGFLYSSYQMMMHGFLTLNSFLALMAWVPAAAGCYFIPQWCGAFLVRVAYARRAQYFQKGR